MSGWEELTAIGTLAAAIGSLAAAVATAIMAYYTRKAIQDSGVDRREASRRFEETRKRDAQHHQDQYRPLLVLMPHGDGAASDRIRFVTISNPDDMSPSLFINGMVQNIGVGPALNVKLSVRMDGMAGIGPTRELASIAANASLVGTGEQFRLPVIYHDSFRKGDLHSLPGGLWLVVLEYDDVFGNTFHTLHRKDQGAPWSEPGRGPAPDTTPRPTSAPAPAHVMPDENSSRVGPSL